jgi:hypothetical protein
MDFTGTILKSDLLEWAEKAGAQFHRSGHEWRSRCPIHKGDNPDGFAVWQEAGKQKWKCFSGSCGMGDVIDFIQAVNGCDNKTAYQILGGETRSDPAEVARRAAEHAAQAAQQLQTEIDRAQRALDELHRVQSWLTYHANLTDERRQLWRERGLSDEWQNYWQLGYCDKFTVGTTDGPHQTATLTIPIKDEREEVVNVRHRLLTPPRPNDKYRPDRPGLTSAPFLAYSQAGYDTERVFVVEGEIKSMVTFRTIFRRNEEPIQVIGIPGKSQFHAIVDRLQGHEVYICLDPDADEQAREFAGMVHGKVLHLPVKIDDAILAGDLDKRGLEFRMRYARKA